MAVTTTGQPVEGAPDHWRELAKFWEERSKEHEKDANYYQKELVSAQTLIGRLLMQLAERRDVARLTKWRSDREAE